METLAEKETRIEEQRKALLRAAEIGSSPMPKEFAARLVFWLDWAGYEIVKKSND